MKMRKKDAIPSVNHRELKTPKLHPGPEEPIDCEHCGGSHKTVHGAVTCAMQARGMRQ